jgi:DNA-binding HxlR family transcriptional regulator
VLAGPSIVTREDVMTDMLQEQSECQAVKDPEVSATISRMLARVGDKWSMLMIRTLGHGPLRFNELRRQVGDISQKVLSSTLKALERDGLVSRTVVPSVPPQVSYELTDLGRELLVPVTAFVGWTIDNTDRILAARHAYDTQHASV